MNGLSRRMTLAPGRARTAREAVGIFLELAKFRLSGMVLLTTAVGFVLAAAADGAGPAVLAWTLLGTACSAAGANTLNQWREIGRDRMMERTRGRPLPSARITPGAALAIGLGCSFVGVGILALGANGVTALLAAIVIVLYVAVYTPLKVLTPLNTVVGAVCGAIPPVMGWTAAAGRIEFGALVLAGILFLWQIPHFLALAWLYRDDYVRGGFRMLPAMDADGGMTGVVSLMHTLALVPIAAGAWAAGLADGAFLAGATLGSLAFAAFGAALLQQRTRAAARRLFLASLVYLPLLLGLMVADRGSRPEADVTVRAGTAAVRPAPAAPGPRRPPA